MALIQCTKKLLAELPLDSEALPRTSNDSSSLLGNWHANLVITKRSKGILFTNDETLFSIFIPKLSKNDFKNLSSIFLEQLLANLEHEGLGQFTDQVFREYQGHLNFVPTGNKSIVASMNNLIYNKKFFYEENINIDVYNIKINRWLNHIPMKIIKYSYPIECLIKTLKAKTGPICSMIK